MTVDPMPEQLGGAILTDGRTGWSFALPGGNRAVVVMFNGKWLLHEYRPDSDQGFTTDGPTLSGALRRVRRYLL
jgi:hypothetical protein